MSGVHSNVGCIMRWFTLKSHTSLIFSYTQELHENGSVSGDANEDDTDSVQAICDCLQEGWTCGELRELKHASYFNDAYYTKWNGVCVKSCCGIVDGKDGKKMICGKLFSDNKEGQRVDRDSGAKLEYYKVSTKTPVWVCPDSDKPNQRATQQEKMCTRGWCAPCKVTMEREAASTHTHEVAPQTRASKRHKPI